MAIQFRPGLAMAALALVSLGFGAGIVFRAPESPSSAGRGTAPVSTAIAKAQGARPQPPPAAESRDESPVPVAANVSKARLAWKGLLERGRREGFDAMDCEAFGRWGRELWLTVMGDPAAFLDCLSTLDDDEFRSLCGLLHPCDPDEGRYEPPDFDRLPGPLAAGLLGYLKDGRVEQKRCMLLLLRRLGSLPAGVEAPCTAILTGPEASLRADALALMDYKAIALPAGFEPVLGTWIDQEGAGLAAGSFLSLNRIDPDGARERLLRRLEVERDPETCMALAQWLRESPDAGPETDLRTSRVLTRALALNRDEEAFRQVVYSSLFLKAGVALAALEPVVGRAPTARMNAALGGIVDALRRGETRNAELVQLLQPVR